MMKVVCAWCKRDMGEKMGPDELTTHGICKDCLEKELVKSHRREDRLADLCKSWEELYRLEDLELRIARAEAYRENR